MVEQEAHKSFRDKNLDPDEDEVDNKVNSLIMRNSFNLVSDFGTPIFVPHTKRIQF
jgi:hypothetical protein